MSDDAPILPGLSPVDSLPVHAKFDGGAMSEGLSWHYYADVAEIDAVAAIGRGLDREFDVKLEQIERVAFDSLGLECPTLNVGILGEVSIKLESDEMIEKIKASPDYGRRYHFIDWADVPEKVFFKPLAPSSEWHSLARLRCLLGLERRHGFQNVIDMFA